MGGRHGSTARHWRGVARGNADGAEGAALTADHVMSVSGAQIYQSRRRFDRFAWQCFLASHNLRGLYPLDMIYLYERGSKPCSVSLICLDSVHTKRVLKTQAAVADLRVIRNIYLRLFWLNTRIDPIPLYGYTC